MPREIQTQTKCQYPDIKVLYIEDEAESRQKLLRVLQRRFPFIHIAIDGEEGFKLFEKIKPDLIITDIKMNQMSGIEMIEKIRSVDDKVQIIVTTAHDDNDFFIQSIENNVNHFILKPIDLERFLQAIQKSVYQIQLEKELDKQKQRTSAILDFQENLIFVIENKQIIECNQAFSSFTGITKHQPLPDSKALFNFFCEDPNYFYPLKPENWIKEFLALDKSIVKVRWRNKAGREAILIMKSTTISEEKNLLFVCTDITELEEESRKNEILAMMDPLTSIYNRLKFDEILSLEMRRAERYHHPFSIIMFDIDFFKNVNDEYGHARGDKVLITLATMIEQRVRECDILARWGGEEFILMAPETNQEGACNLAESLRELISSYPFEEVGTITCSFGVAEFHDGKTKSTLLKEADHALYQSKHKGRNCVSSYTSELLLG